MVRFLPFLISLVLTVYALFSCIQTRSEDVPYLPKVIWVALIVLVPFVGAITWLLVARSRRVPPRQGPSGPRPKPPARPVAPDDDPDFLASLERYRDPRTTPLPPDLRRKETGDSDETDKSEPAAADPPGESPADGEPRTGPEPDAAPDPSTEADGGEGTRKP